MIRIAGWSEQKRVIDSHLSERKSDKLSAAAPQPARWRTRWRAEALVHILNARFTAPTTVAPIVIGKVDFAVERTRRGARLALFEARDQS
jgi:hypothetical protein